MSKRTTTEAQRQQFSETIRQESLNLIDYFRRRPDLVNINVISILATVSGAFCAQASDVKHVHEDLNHIYLLMTTAADAELAAKQAGRGVTIN